MRNTEGGHEDERNDALGERTLLQVAEKSVYKEAKFVPRIENRR